MTRREEWITSNFLDLHKIFVVPRRKIKVFSLPWSSPRMRTLSCRQVRTLNSLFPLDCLPPFLLPVLELLPSKTSRSSNLSRKELVSQSVNLCIRLLCTDSRIISLVGSVYLAKKITTGDYYAIKVLKKSDMVAKNQVTNVKAERMILMTTAESNFVVKLYYTFQSKDYLYLVMEYLNGGDCGALVKNLGGLTEDWAKKYVAEVVVGLEHLHSSGIIHR